MIFQKRIHDDVSPGTAVKNIAHEVQPIHRKAFDHGAERGDEIRSLANLDNRGDDILVVFLFVEFLAVGMKQLFNDIGIISGKRLADLRAGIAGADRTAELDQTIERDAVPLVQIGDFRLELFKLLLGIADQGVELIQLRVGNAVLEERVEVLTDDAGTGIENMQKCLMLSVHVRNEVLTAFGKIQNRLQIDDLGAGGTQGRILVGEHRQVAQFLIGVGFVLLDHTLPPSLGFSRRSAEKPETACWKERVRFR